MKKSTQCIVSRNNLHSRSLDEVFSDDGAKLQNFVSSSADVVLRTSIHLISKTKHKRRIKLNAKNAL